MGMMTPSGGQMPMPQQDMQPQQGGMMGDMMSQQTGKSDPAGIQMLSAIVQNPNPQLVDKLIEHLNTLPNPAAHQVASQLDQIKDNPQAVTQLAQMMLDSFTKGGAS